MKNDTANNGPLAGLKVIDCATVLAGSVVIWTAFVYLIWRLFN